MKRLSMIMMCLLAMMAASLSAKAQEVSITLYPGWTWISYPKVETMDIDSALGDFVPMEGDRIQSQYSSSSYVNGYWRGGVTHFMPGWGYMYYSNRTEPVNLVFGETVPQLIVTTAEPTDITMNSATCGGNVASSNGDYVLVILRGICWSTTQNPTFNDNYVGVENGLGSFTASLVDLAIGTTYYVRAFAVTAEGTFYGEEVSFSTYNNGSIGGHDYIDLGLPSGTLWATCNVGADTPLGYGDYFAWAETQPKDSYFWNTYQYCNGSSNTLTKYCNNPNYGYNGFTDDLSTLLPEDDAATVNWGTDWRTPTKEEWEELYNNTTRTLTTQDGVYGLLFTAPNGYSIFLPAAGICSYAAYVEPGSEGYYMSSTLDSYTPDAAWLLHYSYYTEISNNYYRIRGFSVRPILTTSQPNLPTTVPTGAIDGKFSINADGDQVYFSQGNLQYQASTNTWQFAEQQYDYVGSFNCNISQTYSGWIDLFGWGTSGWHDINDPNNLSYQPWSSSDPVGVSPYNTFGYGPSTNMDSPDLTGSSENYDWGVFNPISNGGNQDHQWRVLTRNEWSYVLNNRSTSSGIRYAKAQITDSNYGTVCGVILFPDDWSTSVYDPNNPNQSDASYSSNDISSDLWNNTLQNAGAVFLPAARGRRGTWIAAEGFGGYWSASYFSASGAYRVSFHDGTSDFTLGSSAHSDRSYGHSVRLVQDVNP